MIPMPLKKIAGKARSARRVISEKAGRLKMHFKAPKPGTPEYMEWLSKLSSKEVMVEVLRVQKKRMVAERKVKRAERERKLTADELERAITGLRYQRLKIASMAVSVAHNLQIDELSALISELQKKLADLRRKK